VRCIPEQPEFEPISKFRAEQVVWEKLRRQLSDEDVLMHGLRFVGDDGDWEADLVLLTVEGFAVIEVKGGYVWYADGEYHQRTPEGDKTSDLDEQALSEKYLVQRYLSRHPRWRHGAVRMAHFVALPDMDLAADADFGPGLPRSRVIAKQDLGRARDQIRRILQGPLSGQPHRPPGPDAVDDAARLLGGVGDPQAELAALRSVRSEHLFRLARDQADVIDMVTHLSRYQVIGGPGSGKTFLAIEQARRWTKSGLRVGFIAYSRGLTTWVDRQTSDWPADMRRRLHVSTFHGLGSEWGVSASENAGQEEWELEIPRRMYELARALPALRRFDALIVDESQDFGKLWWPALLASLADPEHGKLAIFGDGAQQIFGREGAPDLGVPPLQLRSNLRNTTEIGSLVNAMLPDSSMKLLGGRGPVVRFVQCAQGASIGAADDVAVALLDEGWSASDVVLLTTGHRHDMHRDTIDRYGRDEYWALLWDAGDIFYSTVAGFKGLERPAVVIAVNGFLDLTAAHDTLLVGVSRARDQLVICGDAAEIRRFGGHELAKRLGLPPS